MENVTQLYSVAFGALKELKSREQTLLREQKNVQQQAAESKAKNQAQYQSQLQQLQEQLRAAETYYALAEEQLGSAPPVRNSGKAPDLSYMRQLYIYAEEDSRDPSMQKLAEQAAGAVGYLRASRQQLMAGAGTDQVAEAAAKVSAQCDGKIAALYEKLLTGAPLRQLADAVKAQTDPFFISKQQIYDEAVPTTTGPLLKLGAVLRPFPVPAQYEGKLRAMFGSYYDVQTKCLRLPFGFRSDKAVKLLLTAPDAMKERLQNAVIGLLFNIMRHYAPLPGRVVCIDPVTYNPEHLGVMKHFAGKQGFIRFPTSEKEAVSELDRLIADNSGSGVRENRFLIVRGYPEYLSLSLRDKLRNICNNYDLYRISVILIGNREEKLSPQDETALSKAAILRGDGQRFQLQQGGETCGFSWFTAPRQLTDGMIKRFIDAYTPKLLGCAYPQRVSMKTVPQWTKGNRQISVPFGVDEQDQLCSIDFTNTNFAMYLMGAAGSGKSTLLHTIITGLIRNYHPDDVELWLADFKMSEFSQYADPMPPHIKYILMDESPELVYDFVDLLTEKMMERKRYFSRNATVKKLDNVADDTYMPVIFVIIDEFSLMSQALAESYVYKEKLQNLLTEGRALGFKFIFASQEYSNGIQGLTTAAKDQIQMRIAMKNTAAEIRETLDLGGMSVPDHVREWTKTLPPYTALYKTFDRASNQSVLRRAQVLYFPGKGEAAYEPQRQLIRAIGSSMQPVQKNRYSADVHTYVVKEPVIADGTTCQVFTEKRLRKAVADFQRQQTDVLLPEDVPVILGEPRRLLPVAVQPLVSENRENMLLLSGEESACSMSVIRSVMESFRLGDGQVQVWAYRRNRIYGSYKNTAFADYRTFDTPEQIGQAILRLQQQIRGKLQGKMLIVLLGMERVLEDMKALEQDADSADAFAGLEAKTEEEQADAAAVKQYQKDLAEEMDRIQEEGLRDGKTIEQITEECRKLFEQYRKEKGVSVPVRAAQPAAPMTTEKPDYEKALEFVLTNGSKYGYHFLLCARDYNEFRSTLPKLQLFAHKLAFQISPDDSAYLFGNTRASKLPEHICQYISDHSSYSFRPFLHEDVVWDDWMIDSHGKAVRK